MLDVEPANSIGVRAGATGTPVSRPQSRCSSRGNVSPNYASRSPQRFDVDSELTFSPKLNNTSIKLVQDRRNQGCGPRTKSPRRHSGSESESLDFTFRPHMSTASLKIAQGLGTTFMARQEMHIEKQKKLLEQNKQLQGLIPLKGRLSPVIKNKKKDKENADALPWGTPPSKSSLSLDGEDHGNDFISLHPGGVLSESSPSLISSPSHLNPVRGVGRGVSHIQSSINLQPISDTASPYAPGNTSLLLKRQKTTIKERRPRVHKRGHTYPTEVSDTNSGNDSDTQPTQQTSHRRSRTSLSPEPPSPRTRARIMAGQGPAPSGERLRLAKLMAEKAIKKNKVFMIQGPYPVVRECLRRRDWVEKQYRTMAPHKVKKAKNDSDDDSDDDNGDPDDDNDNGCHSDGEDDAGLDDSSSVYGIMSRIVRNSSPNFIWTVKAVGIDYKFLRNNTYVNHFPKNSAFTTKVGLCTNLNAASLGTVDPDSFFPRCYKICSEEDKNAFVADYRLNAACSIVRWVVSRQNGELDIPMEDSDSTCDETENNADGSTSRPASRAASRSASRPASRPTSTTPTADNVPKNSPSKGKKNKAVLTTALIDRSIKVVNNYVSELEHEDIDWPLDKPPVLSDAEWDVFIKDYYQLIHEEGIINGSAKYAEQCKHLINRLRASKIQLDMEGLRNIWIVKPGAKSRGRGITCMNKLEEILKLVGSAIVQKEGKWVVQKYIERPLLIYETKFDIRQWFLVTDWNPLTVWWYKSCYLRFCGQTFSLVKLDSAIHLSNQSVQKNFENSRTRSRMLPENNMWTSEEFQQYLKKRGCGNVWEDVVYPGMKKAVIATMESCQEVLEPRKGCFELYGADFMLTEDFQPWLIEINSSPAMGATTEITEKMCYDVIEDTMKVVLDRKHDKNCDTGNFELAFKQISVPAPQYIGQALALGGTSIRKPTNMNRQKSSPNLVGGSMPRISMTTAPPRKCGEPQRSKTMINKERTPISASDDPSHARASNLDDMKKKLAVSMTAVQSRLHNRRIQEQLRLIHKEIASLTKVQRAPRL